MLQINKNPIIQDAIEKIKLGFKVLPCIGKVPSNRIKSVSKVREKPIHNANVEFYFADATDIALLTGDKLEALDLDLKNDITSNLKNNFLSAVRFTLPEVYEKLVIEESPSGGLHLFYKCNQIGGSKALACRPATSEELAKGERKKVLIETKGEGSQINCSGSPGYKLIQGDFADITFITPDERSFMHAIARSFDKVEQPELKGIHSSFRSKGDAPWVEFNKKHGWQWMTDELCSSGFSKVREDEYRVYLLRDGSNAKTSGAIWKESNTLFLFSTSTEFEAEKPYSAFGVLCQLKYDGKLQDCASDLAEQGVGVWSWSEGEFYTIGHKGKVEFKYNDILQWLHEIGMRKYFYSGTDFEIVQVVGNKVKIVTLDRIKKIFGDYISTTTPDKIRNYFIKHMSSLFTKEGLISQLNDLSDDSFVRSTVDAGWIFFHNGAMRVSKDEKELIPYENLPGYVWEKNIVNRNFIPGSSDCHPKAFIKILAGDRLDMEHRYRLVIGYLLHLYKDPVDPKVIILNDEFYDDSKETEPQGGTGKGLFIKLIKQFLQPLSIDGKRFDLKRNFAFQGMSPDTQLLIIEDAAKGFCFETLFSTITEGVVVEKKGKDEYRIPYERSPKILITTNYAIKGNSSSHLRRRYELEVSPFFSNKVRPVDHFGKRFFEDWNESEWMAFDNYMVDCLQLFLNEGLPEQVTINLEKKKVIQATSRDFFSWVEKVFSTDGLPETIIKSEMMEKFTRLYPDYAYGKLKLSQTKFTQWLTCWCNYRQIHLDASQSYNGSMTYKFKGVLKLDEQPGENSYEVFEKHDSQKFVNEDIERNSSWKPVVSEELF